MRPAPTPHLDGDRLCPRGGRRTGIGLRTPHYRRFLATLPPVGFVEVHSENYFAQGGQPLAVLERVRSSYPLSLHGIGLSLGSAEPLDAAHLKKLGALVRRFEPELVSEHLSWSGIAGRCLNDLLPLPYTEEALQAIARNVDAAQQRLDRRLLIENPSSYLTYRHSTIPEWEFLAALSEATGCGILLDVNNVYVSAVNNGFNPFEYIRGLPVEAVAEIHLAGFGRADALLIDTHGAPVDPAVWGLYRFALAEINEAPTLIEWDTELPELSVLVGQARAADCIRAELRAAKETSYAIAV